MTIQMQNLWIFSWVISYFMIEDTCDMIIIDRILANGTLTAKTTNSFYASVRGITFSCCPSVQSCIFVLILSCTDLN